MNPSMTLQVTLLFIIFILPVSIANDRDVMNLLKRELHISGELDWQNLDCCTWTGIRCNNQSRIVSINLNSESLEGILPENLENLSQLKTFSLQNNYLHGNLPSLANMSLLEEIVLSYNNLTGLIPETWTSLPLLRIVDLSYNNLSGPVPEFRPTVNFTWTGNLLSRQNDKNSGDSTAMALVISAVMGGLVVLGVVGMIAYWCCITANQRVTGGSNGTEMPTVACGISNLEIPIFDFEILQNATNSFNEENKLGSGSYATVYRGVVDGTTVAVKRMDFRTMATRGLSEFQAEIDALTRVRHRNLVGLLGYCITADERILVYEYMSNGTLSQHLFEPEQNGYSHLDWKERLGIAMGIARGIEYLHSGTQDTLIHRDVKPTNILLDDRMRAKVSDFGLAKIISQGHNSVIHTRVAGTIGYVAPECIETITVTRKVDVYAFGVILMELITGRKAFDETKPEDEQAIVLWFHRVFISLENPESIRAYIDQTLEVNNPEIIESIVSVVHLALNCTNWEPRQRQEMTDVVSALRQLVEPPTVPEAEEETPGLSRSLLEMVQDWEAGEGNSSDELFSSVALF